MARRASDPLDGLSAEVESEIESLLLQLVSLVEAKEGGLPAAAKAGALPVDRLYKYVTGKRQATARFDDAFRLAYGAGIPYGEVFYRTYEDFLTRRVTLEQQKHQGPNLRELAGPEPQMVLRKARGQGKPKAGSNRDFWTELKQRPIQRIQLPIDFDDPVDERVLEIDTLRERDPAASVWAAREMVEDCCKAVQRTPTPATLAKYSSALAQWSTSVFFVGDPILASQALERAFELHSHCYQSPSFGDLLFRAASLLCDFCAPEQGLGLARSSTFICFVHGDYVGLGRALIAASVCCAYSGDTAGAWKYVKRCEEIELIPESLRQDAFANRAYLLVQQAQFQEADSVLQTALARKGLTDRKRSKLVWRRACAQANFEPRRAQELFEEAITLAIAHLDPPDSFLVFFDYCQLLRKIDQHEHMSRVAVKLSSCLPRLAETPSAREIAREFLVLAIREAVNGQLIAKAEQQFKDGLCGTSG